MNSVLTIVRKAELSRTEIQLLIDTVLNSYEDETSDWLKVKKLDSVCIPLNVLYTKYNLYIIL